MCSPDRARRYDRALLITNKAANHAHTGILAGLHHGLRARGIESRLFIVEQDGRDLGPFVAAVEQAKATAPDRTFLLDLNGKMRFALTKELKKVSALIDHPFAHFEPLFDAPADALIGYLDRSHREILDAVGLPQAKAFLPHGGPNPDPDPLPLDERPLPALFVGRLETSPRIADLRAGLAGNPDIVRDIVLETAEAAAARVPLYTGFAAACRARGIGPDAFDLAGMAEALHRASDWAEAQHRHRVLTGLGGIEIHHVGAVARDFFAAAPDNVVFHGARPFATCVEMMGRARAVLNSVTVFPDGSHERVWYAMAAGAAVVTDPSAFVAETFTDGENILVWPDGDLAGLAATLADAGRLQAIAAAAAPVYAAHHTWTHRAAVIDRALNGG
ncbi:MAG: glycosyltransferase family 1 protein [Hyphomicrobiales bacterium]|nr:glycosyltransferase family 1 protein [Hyphomicrobiales bacterium]MCP5373653.1 glycosyltransferase family 1 protein [Hyphomicrobiales bacterium]